MLEDVEPFPFLVSSIFFRLPALLGTVKDFVTTGCLLAVLRGSKDFLQYNKTKHVHQLTNYRLNFRIPVLLIWVFKCCYRSPAVFIINIITVYKNHECISFFHPWQDYRPQWHFGYNT